MLLLLGVLALLTAPVILTALGRPAVGGALMLFVLYTRLSDMGFHSTGISAVDPKGLSVAAQASLVALTVLVLSARLRAGASRCLQAHRGTWIALGLYLAVMGASAGWATDAGLAWGQAMSLGKNLVIAWVIAEMFETTQAQRLALWALIAAGALMAGISVFQAATHTFTNSYLGLAQAPVRYIVGKSDSYRSSGPIGDPNFFALVLATLVPLALVRMRDELGLILRVCAAASALLMLGALELTYSRGGLVTAAVAVTLFCVLGRVRGAYLVALAVAGLALLPLVPSNYWPRMATLAAGDSSIDKRMDSQKVALAIFVDHPLVGVGANNYSVVYPVYAGRLNLPETPDRPHNLYLAVAAETGLAGMLTFGSAVLLVLRATWRRRAEAMRAGDRVAEGLATACLLALATYLAGVALLPIAYPRYFWLLVGITLAVTVPAVPRNSRRVPLPAPAIGGAP